MAGKESTVVELSYYDNSNTYLIYQTITLIVLLLLLYWFFRSTTGTDRHYRPRRRYAEGLDIAPNSDANYKFGPLEKGTYGDVPVYFYKSADLMFNPDWRKIDSGIYTPNTRTLWEDTNTPEETSFWATGKLPFKKRKDFINMTDDIPLA